LHHPDDPAWVWLLWATEDGLSSRQIRERLRGRVPIRTIQAGLARVRRQLDSCVQNRPLVPDPRLVPFFPCGPYTPTTRCRHDIEPIRLGSCLCCLVCHRSGLDGHPALRRDPRSDPKPDRKPKQARTPKKETRRSRRKKLYGELGP
jgi:hypothetical protein